MDNLQEKSQAGDNAHRYSVTWRDRCFVLADSGMTISEGGKSLAQFALTDLEAIYEVGAGSDIHATDFEFTIFVFAKRFIVVPAEFFFSVSTPFKALTILLNTRPILWRYATADAPFSWRAWRTNPLACPSVRLAIYERATLAPKMRTWARVRGPRTLADYQNTDITRTDYEEYDRWFWAEAYKKG